MTAADLLAQLDALGVRLQVEDDRLRVNAARGQLTEDLKLAIGTHKPELIALLAARQDPGTSPIRPAAGAGPIPLSFFQERLWVLQRLEPASTDFNLVTAWRNTSGADRVAAALRGIAGRHQILRTRFRDDGGVPVQEVLAAEQVPIELHDLSGLDEAGQQRRLRDAIDAQAHEPFDLTSLPTSRFAVFRLADDLTLTVCAIHHIAADAWSMQLLGRELAAALDADPPGPPPLQYGDYAAWQRSGQHGRTIAAELAWWKERLAGSPPVSTLPPDHPRSERGVGGVRSFTLSQELTAGLHALVREEGVTIYMALVAACAAVLRWQTGQDDLVLGSPMGVRERPELETVIGPFVKVLVLRLGLAGDPTCAELLAQVRGVVLDAHEHQQAPFEKIVEHVKPVRSPDHAPLFQVAVVQHNVPDEGLTQIWGGGAVFDLTWFARESKGRLTGDLEYRADLYAPETIERFATRLEAFLAAMVADRRRKLSQVSLITPDERARVLGPFNATERSYDAATVTRRIAAQTARAPSAPAVAFEGTVLSYAELDARAAGLARHLRALGIGPNVVVGICVPRSLDLLVAVLGVLQAGGAYLPLDPDFPPDRLSFMLEDSGARVVIAGGALPRGLVVPDAVKVFDLGAVPAGPAGPTGAEAGPADLAYLIYTSGSTGRPKGVRVPHRALSNFLSSMAETPGLAAGDVLAAVTTLSFDIAGLELFLPLVVGARIELIARATSTNGAALASRLASSGATLMQATPSTWRLLVEADWRGAPGFRAFCGGEGLPRDLADALLQRTAALWNLYGPTETTIWSTAHQVTGPGPILIGRPIANTRIYILDRGGHPLPPGVPGEIWIGGDGVADGYHARPELTAERFLPDPFDPTPGRRMYRTGDLGRWEASGLLEHLGRVDHQVKVRGFRIELGEIESVLLAHPAMKHAVILARELGPGDVRLIGYLVFQPGEDLTVSDVRRHLRKQLPDYMIPAVVVTLDALPLTPNGKLDRAALPDPFAAAARETTASAPPAPGMEQLLADVWREVLQVERVGADDNFFELGGHSLLSLRVAAVVERRLGWHMDPRLLFFQTLRQLAATAATQTSGTTR